jgi:hypothetical protein
VNSSSTGSGTARSWTSQEPPFRPSVDRESEIAPQIVVWAVSRAVRSLASRGFESPSAFQAAARTHPVRGASTHGLPYPRTWSPKSSGIQGDTRLAPAADLVTRSNHRGARSPARDSCARGGASQLTVEAPRAETSRRFSAEPGDRRESDGQGRPATPAGSVPSNNGDGLLVASPRWSAPRR